MECKESSVDGMYASMWYYVCFLFFLFSFFSFFVFPSILYRSSRSKGLTEEESEVTCRIKLKLRPCGVWSVAAGWAVPRRVYRVWDDPQQPVTPLHDIR